MNSGLADRGHVGRRELSVAGAPAPGREAASKSSLRVLWIDDEPQLLRASVNFLIEQRFHVDFAETSAAGLSLARTRSYDVILLDLAMPSMSGLQLLEVLRQDRIDIPVIIVTGCGTTIAGFDAGRLGAVNLLEKPFREAALLAAIRSTVRDSPSGGSSAPDLRPESRDEGIFSGSADARVAKAIVRVAESPRDVVTVAAWAELVGPAEHTLQNWCNAAGVSPGEALRFARLLRASVRLERLGRPFSESLEIVDPRTLSYFYRLAGGTGRAGSLPRTVNEFIRQQLALSHPYLLELIRELLARRCGDPAYLR